MQNLDYKLEQRWDDIRVPINATKPGSDRIPDWAVYNVNADSLGVWTYWFPDSNEENQRNLFFTVQLPHSYKEQSNLHPHIHWVASTIGSGNIVLGLEYCWQNINEISTSTTIITVVDSVPMILKKHKLTEFDEIIGNGKTISSMLMCRLFRKCEDELDTYAGSIGILEFDFHFLQDDIGSRLELTKN